MLYTWTKHSYTEWCKSTILLAGWIWERRSRMDVGACAMCVFRANVQVDHVTVGGDGNIGSSLMEGQLSLRTRSGEQYYLRRNRWSIMYAITRSSDMPNRDNFGHDVTWQCHTTYPPQYPILLASWNYSPFMSLVTSHQLLLHQGLMEPQNNPPLELSCPK